MAVTVKKLGVWRKEVEDRVGALAEVLEPLAKVGSDLHVVVGYGGPGGKGAVELFPVKGSKSIAAAKEAGLVAAAAPALMVEGDNKPGLGHAITKAVADAGINVAFLTAQALGKKFVAVFGFGDQADAAKAATIIKKAAAARPATKIVRRAPAKSAKAAPKPAAKKATARKRAAKSR
jgi:histone H1/5